MFGYHLRLAWRGLRRQPGPTAVMVVAFALSVGGVATAWAVRDTVASESLGTQAARLFHVQVDDRDPTLVRVFGGRLARSGAMMGFLAWRDWRALRGSGLPMRETAIVIADVPVGEGRPAAERAQFVDADFFAMFGARFRSGGPWRGDEPAVVLDSRLAERLFGEADPVGRTLTVRGDPHVVTGVLEDFNPRPRDYDPVNWVTSAPRVFLSAERLPVMRPWPEIAVRWRPAAPGVDPRFEGDDLWVQYWVELPDAARVEAFRAHVLQYVADERSRGRLRESPPDPLADARTWRRFAYGRAAEAQLLLGLTYLMLAGTAFGLVRMLLARAMVRAPDIALHRALGAPRRAIFVRTVLETQLVGLAGALLGLAVSVAFNAAIRSVFPTFGEHMRLNGPVVGATLLTAAAASLLIGGVAAWRMARTPPVLFARGR